MLTSPQKEKNLNLKTYICTFISQMMTKGEGCGSVVEHVSSICDALGLSLRITSERLGWTPTESKCKETSEQEET